MKLNNVKTYSGSTKDMKILVNNFIRNEYMWESKNYYPNIFTWYTDNIINQDTLDLLPDREIVYISSTTGIILGVAIVKYSENKICSFFVNKHYRKNGYGKRLLKLCNKELKTTKPLISIPYKYDIYYAFTKLFDSFDYSMKILPKYYTKEFDEAIFNS